ncbi:MAG: amidohydrolase family protein, partial [Microvirga sp.]
DILPHRDRFVMFADVDSRWTATHHSPGAAGRLGVLSDRYDLRGLTHYLREDAAEQGGWLLSPDGTAFMEEIGRRRLILSLACAPHQMPAIAALADRHPRVPILLHHMARVRDEPPGRSGVLDLLGVARCGNVFVKMSGFGYAAGTGSAYPYDDLAWIVRIIAEAFGASRMVWGSDYPVSRRYMTYRQTLECLRRQCRFMSSEDIDAVLGGTMQRLLDAAGPQA